MIRVAALQLPASTESLDGNLEMIERGCDEAIDQGAELLVLPELAAIPYIPAGPVEVGRRWFAPIDGPTVRRVGAIARRARVTIILPLALREDDGTSRNAAVVIGPDGRPLDQRDARGGTRRAAHKLHLPFSRRVGDPFDEREHFTAGEHVGVWDTDLGCVAAVICFDRRFPEVWRAHRAAGAWLCAVPVAGSGGDRSDFFIAELRTHAREHGVVAIAANKVGVERLGTGRTEHHGDSLIVDAAGDVLAHRPGDDGPGVVVATIDPAAVRMMRRDFPYFDQRRTDLTVPGPLVPFVDRNETRLPGTDSSRLRSQKPPPEGTESP
jgi:predicted amidohydrolase